MLDSTNMADKDGVVYCKGCHGKKFGPKVCISGCGARNIDSKKRIVWGF